MNKDEIKNLLDHMNELEWASDDEVLIAEANAKREKQLERIEPTFDNPYATQDKIFSRDYWLAQLGFVLHTQFNLTLRQEIPDVLKISKNKLSRLTSEYEPEYNSIIELLNDFKSTMSLKN